MVGDGWLVWVSSRQVQELRIRTLVSVPNKGTRDAVRYVSMSVCECVVCCWWIERFLWMNLVEISPKTSPARMSLFAEFVYACVCVCVRSVSQSIDCVCGDWAVGRHYMLLVIECEYLLIVVFGLIFVSSCCRL